MNTYEIAVYVDGMEFPLIGTLTIEADSEQEAITWVKDNARFEAVKEN